MKELRNNITAVIISLLIPISLVFGFMMFEVHSVVTGDKVAFIVQGYDPTDFLRGHYIRYDILNNMTENVRIADPQNNPTMHNSDYFRSEPGYITLADKNKDGVYDSFGDFYWEKPNVPYINGFCSYYGRYYSEDDPKYNYQLDSNQERYYLDENLASFVEAEITDAGEFNIVGTIKNGLFRASHIEVKGIVY